MNISGVFTEIREQRENEVHRFFAGIGGFHSGLEKAGMECIGWCEVEISINLSHVQTFRLHKRAVKNFNLICRKERRV